MTDTLIENHSQLSVSFTPGDATWHRLRDRARSDLFFLAGVILKLGDAVGMTEGMHRLLCRVAERRTGVPELDQCPHRLFLMPRGTGKSSLITQAYAIQCILNDPNTALLISNERLDNAVGFLAAIKGHFESNELFRALFPEVIPPDFNKTTWSEVKTNVPRTTGRIECTITCIGAGGTVTGQHPDKIFADDMISREAMENARRGDGGITQQMNRWVNQLLPLLNAGALPFPEINVIGTRWYRGDSYEHVETAFGNGEERKTWLLSVRMPNGETMPVPVHRRGDLLIFSRQVMENGRPVWPERPGYDVDALAKFRLRDPELYAANMMNDPTDDLTATFKEAWLDTYQWVNDGQIQWTADAKTQNAMLDELDILVLVDPGGFAKAKGGDRMRGAILVTGSTLGTTPTHFVLDAYSEPVTFNQLAEQILTFTTRYTPRRVFIEEVGQQAAFLELVRRLAADRGVMLPLERMTPEGQNKEAKILRLEPWFQRGLIRVGAGAVFHELREQYRSFPRGTRVDLLDTLSYGPKVWRKAQMTPKTAQQRQDAERMQYYAKRGVPR